MSLTVESREVDVTHYYPNTVAPSLEFKTLATIENIEFNTFWGRFWQLMANTFVYDANIIGIKRWEEMLSIFPTADETLDERRAAILAKLNATLPYTERRLQEMLNANYGEGAFTVKLDYNKYEIYLDSSISGYPYCAKAVKFTHVIIPANLVLYLMFICSQKWEIKHKAEIMGYVNGEHIFWNLGTSSKTYWNGEYRWDKTIRWDGKDPSEAYREHQAHKAEVYRLIAVTQDRPYYIGDGNTWETTNNTWDKSFFAWSADVHPTAMVIHTCKAVSIDKDGNEIGEVSNL